MKKLKYLTSDIEKVEDKNLTDSPNDFDKLLLDTWYHAMDTDCFKFKLDKDIPTRYMSGKYSLLLQLNPKRFDKRPTDFEKPKMNQPFDKNKFNFTKIKKNEVLFEMSNYEDGLNSDQHNDSDFNDPTKNFIIINNSPIDVGHSLILPRLYSCLNQVIDQKSIQLAIETAFLSCTSNLLIGFNSLNAYASVNHLHLHFYYLFTSDSLRKKNPLPIQNLKYAVPLKEKLWMITDDLYFLPAFALQSCDFNNNIMELSRKIYDIANYLHKNEIAHNIIFVKCEPFRPANTCINDQIEENEPEQTQITLRILVCPKKPSYEFESNKKIIGFALCELAGHFLVQKEEDFNEMDESEIIDLACQSKLEKNLLESIINNVKNLF